MPYTEEKYVIGYMGKTIPAKKKKKVEKLYTLGSLSCGDSKSLMPWNDVAIFDLIKGSQPKNTFVYNKQDIAETRLKHYRELCTKNNDHKLPFIKDSNASMDRHEYVGPDQLGVFKINMTFEAVATKAPVLEPTD